MVEGGRGDGGGRSFEAGCLLTFSTFRMGAYSRLGFLSWSWELGCKVMTSRHVPLDRRIFDF